MRRSPFMLLVLFLLVLSASSFTFVAGFGVGWYAHKPPTPVTPAPSPTPTTVATKEDGQKDKPIDSRLSTFWEAWQLVDRDFYSEKPLDYQQVTYGAIRGLLGALGDPYTIFVEPPQHELEKSGYQGKFGGIGARISINDKKQPMLVEIIKNTPAEAAGLQPGDIVLQVDGKPVEGLSLDQVVLKIRGPVGTTVELLMQREGQAAPLRFSIVRAEIKQPTVEWKMLDEGRIGYVQLTLFAEPTGNELAEALREVRKAGAAKGVKEPGIILDLRGNRGGLLAAAGEVTAQFIKSGVLLYERKHGPEGSDIEEAYMIPVNTKGSPSRPLLEKELLVILVDKGTASASEIVAGAIQDYKRGILIGETTFGKGSVQFLHELSDKSSLHVTSANWLTPLKRRIHGSGLTPDVEVRRSDEDIRVGRDPQLDRAIEHLRERHQSK